MTNIILDNFRGTIENVENEYKKMHNGFIVYDGHETVNENLSLNGIIMSCRSFLDIYHDVLSSNELIQLEYNKGMCDNNYIFHAIFGYTNFTQGLLSLIYRTAKVHVCVSQMFGDTIMEQLFARLLEIYNIAIDGHIYESGDMIMFTNVCSDIAKIYDELYDNLYDTSFDQCAEYFTKLDKLLKRHFE